MLGYSILKYDEKKEFEASLASWLGGFWLEVKIGITILLFVGVLGFAGAILLGTSGPTGVLGRCCICPMRLCCVVVGIRHNPRYFL